MLNQRPTHPEHHFTIRPRIAEVAIPIPTHRSALADAPARTVLAETPRNRLLGALSASERELLAPALERTTLAAGQQLTRPGTAPSHLYFPETAVVALQVNPIGGGRSVDVATVGAEGMIGVSQVLGGEPGPEAAVVRVGGSAARVPAADFERILNAAPASRARMLRYAAALIGQMAQTALCVQAHTIEQRLASLILLIADRIEHAPIVVTHEQLGLMLGIRRPGVTQVAATLRGRGLVAYRRGKIVIGDRAGLLATACPCYQIVRDTLRNTAFEAMPTLSGPTVTRPLA